MDIAFKESTTLVLTTSVLLFSGMSVAGWLNTLVSVDMILITFFSTAFHSALLSILYRETAYLDPGSGSFLLQLLIGGFVGLLFVLKTYWRQFKAFVLRLLGKTPATPDNTAGTEEAQDAP